MMSGKFFIPVFFLIVSGALVFWLRQEKSAEELRERKLPQAELRTLEGGSFKFGEQNIPLIVNVWATWCPFCLKEIEYFAELEKNSEGKFKVILVNRGENAETVQRYLGGIAQFASTTAVLLDAKDLFYPAIGGFSMPETLFVDAGGIILYHKRGPMEREEIKRRVESLMNGVSK